MKRKTWRRTSNRRKRTRSELIAVFRSNDSKLHSWDKVTVSFFPINQEEEKEKEEEEVQKDEEEEDEEKEEVEEEEEENTTIMSLPQQCSRLAVVVKVIVSFQ